MRQPSSPSCCIYGGEATWVLRSGRGGLPLCVIAQQWASPRMLIDAGAEVSITRGSLHFDYLAQRDPTVVVEELGSA